MKEEVLRLIRNIQGPERCPRNYVRALCRLYGVQFRTSGGKISEFAEWLFDIFARGRAEGIFRPIHAYHDPALDELELVDFDRLWHLLEPVCVLVAREQLEAL